MGRLSPEKGISHLLEVASRLPYRLKVAGGGPLEAGLRAQYAGNPSIDFLGVLDAAAVARLLSSARFSVVPSQGYENNPLSVIEALCAGTPVVGARMGGIPELIDSESGMVFDAFESQALETAISMSMARQWDHGAIARSALERFGPQAHLEVLINDIYQL